MVQEAQDSLITWPEPVMHLLTFITAFLASGAIGFRFAAVRDRLTRTDLAADERAVYDTATRRAAIMGLIGILYTAFMQARGLPGFAARKHMTVGHLITSDLGTGLSVVLLALAVIGFLLASGRVRAGWVLAGIGVVLAPFTGLASGQLPRIVNPVHVLVAGLWIGTLFVLVAVGIEMVLTNEPVKARRGAIVADMVNGFSPLALTCGSILVLTGLITAWRHLPKISDLWTSPYGYTLIAKLCVVAVVFALGAWNWKRQRPTLGSEETAIAIRRSSTRELLAAGVVLLITAILVSLPGPGGPGGPGGPPPAQGAPPPG